MKRGIEYALESLYYPISSYYRLNSLYELENRSYTPVFFPLNKSPHKLHSDMYSVLAFIQCLYISLAAVGSVNGDGEILGSGT